VANDDDCTAPGGCQRLFYMNDANMNVTALVDASSGSVVERVVYDPYGKPKFYDNSWANPSDTSAYANDILYCGYRFDPETGLYHVRYRYYHPTLGRWTARDPIGYRDGKNIYQYASSVPIGRIDPWGLTVGDETEQEVQEWHRRAEATTTYKTDWGNSWFYWFDDDSEVTLYADVFAPSGCEDKGQIAIAVEVEDFRDDIINPDPYKSKFNGSLSYTIKSNPCSISLEEGIRETVKNISVAGRLSIRAWASAPVEEGPCCCQFDVNLTITYGNARNSAGGGTLGVNVLGSGGQAGVQGAVTSGGEVGKTHTVRIGGGGYRR